MDYCYDYCSYKIDLGLVPTDLKMVGKKGKISACN